MAHKSSRTNFDNVLQMVKDDPKVVFGRYARMLSDLSAEKAAKLGAVLEGLTPERRAAFYQGMKETHHESFEYDFSPIAKIGLKDADGEIRADAIEILGLEDSRETGARILEAAQFDPSEKAQITAIDVLGQYMLEDDLGGTIPVDRKKLREALEKLIENKSAAVRRAAVVAYAVSETKRVNEIIRGYLAGNDRDELIAALRAISISMNDEFSESVLELLEHDDEEIVIEAIRAAGALQLKEALPALFEMISRFDRITPDLLLAAVGAVSEIGDESGMDVLETLGEAAVDMDDEITESIDDCIDTLNMTLYMGPFDEDEEEEGTRKAPRKSQLMLREAIERSKDRCLTILEEKIPHDLEDDEAFDFEEEDDEEEACDCGEHHHHHHHHHDHDHDHDNPLKGLDLSRFRILDDLEAYESSAHHDADEEELWAEFEDMAEEDLDADSLQDFINKLEAKKKKK